MKRLSAFFAALAALAASPASAQLVGDAEADIECLAATLIISQNPEDPRAEQAMTAVMYFIGKITARELDYTERLETAMRAMTYETMEQAAMRCGAELEYVGNDMQRRGAQIEAREQRELQQ